MGIASDGQLWISRNERLPIVFITDHRHARFDCQYRLMRR